MAGQIRNKFKSKVRQAWEGQAKEADLQKACVKWFRHQHPGKLLFHIPNGGFRNVREAADFKRQGVMSGVADLQLIYQGKSYFFELKAGSNKQSENQKLFQYKIEKEGFQYFLIYDLMTFINRVNSIFADK